MGGDRKRALEDLPRRWKCWRDTHGLRRGVRSEMVAVGAPNLEQREGSLSRPRPTENEIPLPSRLIVGELTSDGTTVLSLSL